MARDHLSRFSKGRRGISNVFKRSYKLRKYLGTKDRKQAIEDLQKHSTGGGVSGRPGSQIYRSELEGVYGKWKRDRKDRINTAEARMIKKELQKYQSRLEMDQRHGRTSRAYFRDHTDPVTRSKDVPIPGGDVRPGSFGSSDSFSSNNAAPGFDEGFGGGVSPAEGPNGGDSPRQP